jgi:hypothetical protein
MSEGPNGRDPLKVHVRTSVRTEMRCCEQWKGSTQPSGRASATYEDCCYPFGCPISCLDPANANLNSCIIMIFYAYLKRLIGCVL